MLFVTKITMSWHPLRPQCTTAASPYPTLMKETGAGKLAPAQPGPPAPGPPSPPRHLPGFPQPGLGLSSASGSSSLIIHLFDSPRPARNPSARPGPHRSGLRPPPGPLGPPHGSRAHTWVPPRAPRRTRYLPSGENLQSRPESLNDSEKFMAAASPGPAAPRQGRQPPRVADGSTGAEASRSQWEPRAAARHYGAGSPSSRL